MDEFAAIDFETTGYENGGSNEPWQLGIAVVRGGEIVETREFFFDVEGAPARAHEADSLGTLQSSFDVWLMSEYTTLDSPSPTVREVMLVASF